jgi:hypothetical protein
MATWLSRVGLCAAVAMPWIVSSANARAQEAPTDPAASTDGTAPALGGGASSSPAGSRQRVAVLRFTQGEASAQAEAIDGALLRDLAAIAGIENPTVSPIDYAEIQLTVGCSDEGRQCLSSIAQMVQVDAVVVRKLSVAPDRATLTLVYLDATASDDPAHAEHVIEGEASADALAGAVPSLVRRLFGIPEPVVAAAPETRAPGEVASTESANAPPVPVDSAERRGGIGVLTWVALAVGAGALGAGVVLGLGAQSSFDEFKNTAVEDADDRRRAEQRFDDAESKGRLATVLIPAGAVVLALGATLLVLDLSDDGGGETELGLQPLSGGALLSLRGTVGR